MKAPSEEVRLYRQEIAASVKKHWKDDPIELSLLIRESWDEEIAEGEKPEEDPGNRTGSSPDPDRDHRRSAPDRESLRRF